MNVAARGVDIKGVDHVINYDMPQQIDDYVHRILFRLTPSWPVPGRRRPILAVG